MKTEQIELRLKLVREFCKYCFSYKFTKAGFIYSPSKLVCELVFKTMLIMKSHGLDVLVLLAAPDLQAYLVWENYIEEKVNG